MAPTAPSRPPTTAPPASIAMNTSSVGMRDRYGQLTRSPSIESTAGSRVIDDATDTSTTMIAPPARLRKIVVGTRSMPARATTTVSPLKNTARDAVAPEARIASFFSRPLWRSSR